jgi:hypothetical protein
MEGEHCARFDSDEAFETGNYRITTTPRREWRIVVDGDAELADMRAGRRIPAIRELMALQTARDAGLEEQEVVAVVIYTGPMVALPSSLKPSKAFPNSLISLELSRALPCSAQRALIRSPSLFLPPPPSLSRLKHSLKLSQYLRVPSSPMLSQAPKSLSSSLKTSQSLAIARPRARSLSLAPIWRVPDGALDYRAAHSIAFLQNQALCAPASA